MSRLRNPHVRAELLAALRDSRQVAHLALDLSLAVRFDYQAEHVHTTVARLESATSTPGPIAVELPLVHRLVVVRFIDENEEWFAGRDWTRDNEPRTFRFDRLESPLALSAPPPEPHHG